MNTVFLLLGGNKGGREKNLSIATAHIAREIGTVEKRSSVYETSAWGKEDQPPFLNQVLVVKTVQSPRSILDHVLGIEKKMGRERQEKWEARIIDIDILFFNGETVREEGLVVPHPFIQDRRFTLVPLAEIAPGMLHPVLAKTMTELLEACKDPLEVRKWK